MLHRGPGRGKATRTLVEGGAAAHGQPPPPPARPSSARVAPACGACRVGCRCCQVGRWCCQVGCQCCRVGCRRQRLAGPHDAAPAHVHSPTVPAWRVCVCQMRLQKGLRRAWGRHWVTELGGRHWVTELWGQAFGVCKSALGAVVNQC